jgi:hypothetical protein
MTNEELNKLKRDIEELACSTSVKSGKTLLRNIQFQITMLKPTVEDAYASNLLSEISTTIESVPGNQRNGENMLAMAKQKLYQLENYV